MPGMATLFATHCRKLLKMKLARGFINQIENYT